MRILFIGDIVGRPGVRLVQQLVPALRAAGRADFVIANAENAANGSGCTPADYRRLREAGVDLITLGDHIYKKAEIIGTLESEERICKPANYPPAAPGREFALAAAADGTTVAVVSLLGRTFMRPVDCPFLAADRVLAQLADKARVIVVDVHAEATSENQCREYRAGGLGKDDQGDGHQSRHDYDIDGHRFDDACQGRERGDGHQG